MNEGKIDGMIIRVHFEGFQKYIHSDPVPETEHVHQSLFHIVDFQRHSLHVMCFNARFINGITKPECVHEWIGRPGSIPLVRNGNITAWGICVVMSWNESADTRQITAAGYLLATMSISGS